MASKTEQKKAEQKKAQATCASTTTSSGRGADYGYATGGGVEAHDRQAEANDEPASGVVQGPVPDCGFAVRGAEAVSEEPEAGEFQVQRRADPALGAGYARRRF